MPFRYKGWTLYSVDVTDKNEIVTIYFFHEGTPEKGRPVERLPVGMEVSTDSQTGLPVLRENAKISALRKLDPFEFQEWVCRKLSARPSKSLRGDMGLDGWLPDGRPIQVKRQDAVGRPQIDSLIGVLLRERKEAGMLIAFSFTKGAYREAQRLEGEHQITVELKTIAELIE